MSIDFSSVPDSTLHTNSIVGCDPDYIMVPFEEKLNWLGSNYGDADNYKPWCAFIPMFIIMLW